MATKIAHAGVCYLIKKVQCKCTYLAKMAISDSVQVALPFQFSSSITIHIIHKSDFNYDYITVEYKQPSFVNIQCVLRR